MPLNIPNSAKNSRPGHLLMNTCATGAPISGARPWRQGASGRKKPVSLGSGSMWETEPRTKPFDRTATKNHFNHRGHRGTRRKTKIYSKGRGGRKGTKREVSAL